MKKLTLLKWFWNYNVCCIRIQIFYFIFSYICRAISTQTNSKSVLGEKKLTVSNVNISKRKIGKRVRFFALNRYFNSQ